MTTQTIPTLVKLGETDFTVADRAEDIRGRVVLDRTGEKIGHVSALMIDEQESKVRFMEIASGGILGIGEKTFLMPIDTITKIDEKHVHIDRTHQAVSAAPAYEPKMVSERDYNDAYGYYGYSPFWMGGYSYPAFPYYGML